MTRPREQAAPFTRALEARGAAVVEFPTIRIRPSPEPERLEEALRSLVTYDWVVFTSVNGVRSSEAALTEIGLGADAFEGVRVAAIGPGTAGALERLGVDVDLVPGEYRAEALAEALLTRLGGEGSRILLPRAAEAREVLVDRLRKAGAEVDEVAAYRTEAPAGADVAFIRDGLRTGRIDWLTFTASSTVRNFVDLVGAEQGEARVAAIGPITAGTARDEGFRVDVVAEEYTIPGLVEALVRYASGDGETA